MGSGIKGLQRCGIRDHSPGSGITARGIGISSVFHGIRDQAVLDNNEDRDQGSEFLSLLRSEIKILGKKMGSATKKYTSLRP